MSENLSFLSSKKQFQWSGDVDSLKAFWIDELEKGDPSLPMINSNGTCDVLKFESVTDEGLTLETSVQNHFHGVKLIYINLKLIHYTNLSPSTFIIEQKLYKFKGFPKKNTSKS